MFKFLIAVIIITLNAADLFAAVDVPFPDDKLRALPVYVRHDAKQFYDGAHHFFAIGKDLSEENPYKLLFKGLIFGQTFGFSIDTDKLLNTALKKLVSKGEFQDSKIFFSKTIKRTHIPTLKKTVLNRTLHRNNFKMASDPALESLYKSGNVYALSIKGLLDYDEATDVQGGNTKESIANLELAAHHFCLPALRFCSWLYDDREETNNIYETKLKTITQNDATYNPAYFDSFLYVIELIKNPFEKVHHIDFESPSICPSFISGSKVYPPGLPVINVLDKIKRSIMLTIDDTTKEYYERVLESLARSAGETRRSQPTRKKYERIALVSIGMVGTVGGILSSNWSASGSIITTIGSVSLTSYGVYKMLSVSPVCYGDQSYIDDQIELLSLYLSLKENQNFVKDTEAVFDVFKLGIEDRWRNKISRFIRRDQLTLSKMILKKEGRL